MDRYFTVMVIPEREKGVKSFRIPRVVFHGLLFLTLAVLGVVAVLSYDYIKIIRQVYENKHLSIENRQLREQLKLSHMKLNSLADEIGRIKTFEKKLRIITGFEESDLIKHGLEIGDGNNERHPDSTTEHEDRSYLEDEKVDLSDIRESKKYIELLDLYEQKLAPHFGLGTGYTITKEWDQLTKQSFALAVDFAEFDAKYEIVKGHITNLELRIHDLDQFLLDRESFLKATPTLMPADGWITSYYGPRMSHYSGRVKMHEGLDIGAPIGTPIVAPADGIVTFSGEKPGFGYFVQIDHGYGVETVFGHNSRILVRKGETIRRGQPIAKVGNTGFSTGPHLHYEVRVNGTPVDPLFYILD